LRRNVCSEDFVSAKLAICRLKRCGGRGKLATRRGGIGCDTNGVAQPRVTAHYRICFPNADANASGPDCMVTADIKIALATNKNETAATTGPLVSAARRFTKYRLIPPPTHEICYKHSRFGF